MGAIHVDEPCDEIAKLDAVAKEVEVFGDFNLQQGEAALVRKLDAAKFAAGKDALRRWFVGLGLSVEPDCVAEYLFERVLPARKAKGKLERGAEGRIQRVSRVRTCG